MRFGILYNGRVINLLWRRHEWRTKVKSMTPIAISDRKVNTVHNKYFTLILMVELSVTKCKDNVTAVNR